MIEHSLVILFGVLLLGWFLLGLGILFAKSTQFIGNRPDIGFVLLTGYGLTVLGFIALICGVFF